MATLRPNLQIGRDLWAKVKGDATLNSKTVSEIVDDILRKHYGVQPKGAN